MIFTNVTAKFSRLLFLIVLSTVITACGGPPRVWVLGEQENESIIQFSKAPKFLLHGNKAYNGTQKPYKLAKKGILIFQMEEEGAYKASLKTAAGSSNIEFKADDAYGKLTVIDASEKSYLVVQDVGSLYSKNKLDVLPITQISNPTKVHTLDADPQHSFWWTSRLPSSMTGVSIGGSDGTVSAYKIFVLAKEIIEGNSKEELEKKLTIITLKLEQRR